MNFPLGDCLSGTSDGSPFGQKNHKLCSCCPAAHEELANARFRFRTAMSKTRHLWRTLTDLIIPIGAVLVLLYSLGSIFVHDGKLQFASTRPPPPHLIKAYRRDLVQEAP